MSNLKTEELSDFLAASIALDKSFKEISKLSKSLKRTNIQTDKGFERAKEFFERFNKCRQNIGEDMALLGRTLEKARADFEDESNEVADIATQLVERQKLMEVFVSKFRQLGEKVADISKISSQIQSDENQTEGGTIQLADMQTSLSSIVEETNMLKNEAKEAGLKEFEFSLDSLRQKLNSTNIRLSQMGVRA